MSHTDDSSVEICADLGWNTAGHDGAYVGSDASTTVSMLCSAYVADEHGQDDVMEPTSTVLKSLGKGVSGDVYEAIDETGMPLAVKKARVSQYNPVLEQEFVTAQRIGPHPNIVQSYSCDVDTDGRAFIVMELMSKGSLQDAIDANNAKGTVFSEDEIRRALREVLTGLAHLHRLGFAHGDIKPANILLGDGGAVKISDFGCTGVETPKLVGMSIGTPRFMSLDAMEGKHLFANDMWAVGCCLGYLATGEKPWADIDRENNFALCYAIDNALSRGVTPFAASDVERLSEPQQRLLEHLFNSDASQRPTAAKLLADPYFAVTDVVALESCGDFSDIGRMPTSFPAQVDGADFEDAPDHVCYRQISAVSKCL